MGLIDKFIEIKTTEGTKAIVLVLDKVKIRKITKYICSENNGTIHIVNPEENTILKLWEKDDVLEEISKNNFIYTIIPSNSINPEETIVPSNYPEYKSVDEAKKSLQQAPHMEQHRLLILKYNPNTPEEYKISSVFNGEEWVDVPEEEQ